MTFPGQAKPLANPDKILISLNILPVGMINASAYTISVSEADEQEQISIINGALSQHEQFA